MRIPRLFAWLLALTVAGSPVWAQDTSRVYIQYQDGFTGRSVVVLSSVTEAKANEWLDLINDLQDSTKLADVIAAHTADGLAAASLRFIGVGEMIYFTLPVVTEYLMIGAGRNLIVDAHVTAQQALQWQADVDAAKDSIPLLVALLTQHASQGLLGITRPKILRARIGRIMVWQGTLTPPAPAPRSGLTVSIGLAGVPEALVYSRPEAGATADDWEKTLRTIKDPDALAAFVLSDDHAGVHSARIRYMAANNMYLVRTFRTRR